MKDILNFLIEVSKLKEIPRTGLVVWKAKNPATIADHTFRTAFSSRLLSPKRNLNIEKIIKIVLAHDLCEVYAGDLTPLFYYTRRTKRMMRWFRLPKIEREKRAKRKLEVEKKALLKLIKFLKPDLGKEIFSFWFDFVTRISPEAKFIKQVDRIETLLESIEYIGTNEKITGKGWWEGTEEIVEDPFLLCFLKIIQKKFYGWAPAIHRRQKELENILNFLLEVGKLERMPRRIWCLLGVKGSLETVAGHIFSLSLMTWILGREKKELDMEKLLKMALYHEIPAVYTGDLISPFRMAIIKAGGKWRKVFEKWPRLSKTEKERRFLKDYEKERKALIRLTFKLNVSLRREIIQLFDEYKTSSTAEARFLNQVNVSAVLLQALLYWKKDKNLQVDWMWEWAFEKCEDPIILEFLDALKEKFY